MKKVKHALKNFSKITITKHSKEGLSRKVLHAADKILTTSIPNSKCDICYL